MPANMKKPAAFFKKKALLNVLLGKSPGEALAKFGHQAYSLEAQKLDCHRCFDRKYGRKKWKVLTYFIRDVSARRSKAWPKILQDILQDTLANHAVLATSTVCVAC